MDNKLIRFYNQNRMMFWTIILTIAAVIILIHVLNNFLSEQQSNNMSAQIEMENYSIKTDKDYSVITGKKINSEISEIIDLFINYCNNGNVTEAYALLSNDCKNLLYPTIEKFKEDYYSKIFNTKKLFKAQAMFSNDGVYTYQISFTEDILATGKISGKSIIDNYTIVNNDGIKKLNINNLINVKPLNINRSRRNIEIDLLDRIIFRDYEIYKMRIKNNNTYQIKLDNLQQTDNIYVEDTQGNQYLWFNHEYIDDDVTIDRGDTKDIKIKINKEYMPQLESKKLVFQKIYLKNDNTLQIEIEV